MIDANAIPSLASPVGSLLADALARTIANHWSGKRSEASLKGQARKAIQDLEGVLGVSHVSEVNSEHCKALVTKWKSEGYAPRTIKKRMVILGQLGCNVKGTKIGGFNAKKWWLNPADKTKLTAWLGTMEASEDPCRATYAIVLDYVEWACHNALRVEESLRLTWGDIVFFRDAEGNLSPDKMSVRVPGTKTEGSMATIPMSRAAGVLLLKRFTEGGKEQPLGSKVFPISYDTLRRYWVKCREHIGATTDHTATLKSLRRTAARGLHVDKGMPLGMVQRMLRHASMQTTIEYLKLTGAYSEDEMRRYL